MRRSLIAAFLAAALVGGLTTVASASPDKSTRNSYIVVLQPGTTDVPGVANGLAASVRGKVDFVYEHALEGFSIRVPESAAAALARNPRVAYVELDRKVTLAAQDTPTGIDRIFATDNTAIDIDGSDDLRVDVDVAVIDTGVDWDHPDLNVVDGVNCAQGAPHRPKCNGNGDDDHYHGTHVAGTIGALDNDLGVVGVAPGARIHAVKVLNSRGSGYASWIVAGIDWVAGRGDIEVANMSLGGGGYSQAEYDAIQGAVDAGVAFAVAAGNDDDDAQNYSPAAFDNVLTVSALADFDGAPGEQGSSTCRVDEDDTLASFSNWGPAVDIAAPGVCILSTYPIEQGGYGTISGTSMASPHVAGALALLASRDNPVNASDVGALYSAVIAAGNNNWIDDSGDDIQEPLLNVAGFNPVLIATGGGGGGDTAPEVSIISPSDGASFASGAIVEFSGSAIDAEDGDLASAVAWSSDLDGPLGTGGSVSGVLMDGEHLITAVVTDSGSNSASASITITVQAPPGPETITLDEPTTGKSKGRLYADLSWTGAEGSVDILRNGSIREAGVETSPYRDSTGWRGSGSATYQVCESGSVTNCSNTVVATWG